MSRPKTVYRGKRKYGWVVTLVLFLLVAAILLTVWLFYYLQQFIVYDKDGLHIEMPYMRQEQAGSDPVSPSAPALPGVDAEIVIDPTDYSSVVTSAGEGLDPIRAKYLKAGDLSSAGITLACTDMEGFDTLVLQLKGTDGMLAYQSGLAIATSYGVNGTEDISGAVAMAKEKGIRLVAELSAIADTAMALHYAPAALKSSLTGSVITQDGQAWLDPYSDVTRSYLSDLMDELALMGFEEIIFTGLTFPETGDVVFSQSMTGRPTSVDCVGSLAMFLRQKADGLGVKISAKIENVSLRDGTCSGIGQDAEMFFRIFDRVLIDTDHYFMAGDMELLSRALGQTDAIRCVAVVEGYTPEWDSFVRK